MSGGWHLGTLFGLDFETTGIDVENDRIVTCCIAIIDGTGQRPPETIDMVIDPGIPVPDEAAKIHGWTTDRIKNHDGVYQARDAIEFILDSLTLLLLDDPNAPLIGHNVGGFDLSMLDREARRHGFTPLQDRLGTRPLHVVDTLVISRRIHPNRRRVSPSQGPHVLKTCAQVFGVPWDDEQAHDASYDVLTSCRVAWRMASRPEIRRMSLAELHAAQARWKREQDEGLSAWLRSRGENPVGLDGSWPVRPFDGQMELAS